jgi:catechol 2,3-dioxygenase-like lactoylglutathione lyase family enzyme
MFNSLSISSIYVLDQDEALDFYVGKLGLEVRNDIDMGFMRWLTVGVPGDEGREILLERPAPPSIDESTAEQVRELVAKGAMGFTAGFTTKDCRGTYEELRAKGVEFTQEPVDRFYGVDCGLRDPFGNNIRLVEPIEGPIPTPSQEELAKEFS